MTSLLILTAFASLGKSAPDTNLKPLIREFLKIERYLATPPEYANSDTSFYYAELLILDINKSGKVSDITLNDHAPGWLKQSMTSIKDKKLINVLRLDSLALKSGIKKCKLIFPLIIESDNFPDTKSPAKEHIGNDFYQIQGKTFPAALPLWILYNLYGLWYHIFIHSITKIVICKHQVYFISDRGARVS